MRNITRELEAACGVSYLYPIKMFLIKCVDVFITWLQEGSSSEQVNMQTSVCYRQEFLEKLSDYLLKNCFSAIS
jgi:hypothetical protein